MKKIGMILTPDVRSKAYLSKLVDNKIKLNQIIFMNDDREEKKFSNKEINQAKLYGIRIEKSVKTILNENYTHFKEFPFVDINNLELRNFIKQSRIDFYIFTGGGILESEILSSGPRFIHFHPGLVPFYRGSTCFYYSIINDDKCGVTAYVMDEKLDAGKIIHQKSFSKPSHIFIDDIFDAIIGIPHAIASIIGKPNPSNNVGITKTSAKLYIAGNSSLTLCKNMTSFSIL